MCIKPIIYWQITEQRTLNLKIGLLASVFNIISDKLRILLPVQPLRIHGNVVDTLIIHW